ncbi:MAG TPA: hypothetical protein VKA49_11205, partial [Flavitalea sp.]|nr:hypothetical protein [Flavitalea sp.]
MEFDKPIFLRFRNFVHQYRHRCRYKWARYDYGLRKLKKQTILAARDGTGKNPGVPDFFYA